jgi:metal-responsive CopG/Arc/MetJ family transcriptional regulator
MIATSGVIAMKKLMQISIDQALLDGLEAYRKRQTGEIPSRAQAIRELLEWALREDAAEVVS